MFRSISDTVVTIGASGALIEANRDLSPLIGTEAAQLAAEGHHFDVWLGGADAPEVPVIGRQSSTSNKGFARALESGK